MGDSSVTSTSTKKKRMKNPFKSLARGISTKKKKKNKDDASVVSNTVIASNTNGAATSTSRNGIPSRVGGQQQQGVRSNYRPASSSSSSNNKPSATNSSSSSSSSIQVVLLLMDPQTRRFELLQLEFDSQKALVNDVLRQITTSATETSLREMDYSGVCDVEGKEMVGGERLAKFCTGGSNSNSNSVVDVVMAMPAGMGGAATANLARPILGDPKVVEMLRPCGVNLENILEKRPKQVYFNNSKTTSTSGDETMSASTNLTQINEEDDDDDDDDNNTKKTRDYNSPAAKAERARKRAKKKGRAAGGGGLKEKLTSVPTLALTFLFVAMVAYAVKLHVRVTQPITLTSNLLLPGEWKSTCGILDVLPQQLVSSRAVQYVGGMMKNDKCSIDSTTPLSSSMLEMGKDGTLRYFTTNDDGERKEAWSVVGDYSDGGGGNANDNTTASCVKEDVNGQCLQMQEQQDKNSNNNNNINSNKGATFVKENESWYVIMGKTRTALNKDVIREFTL